MRLKHLASVKGMKSERHLFLSILQRGKLLSIKSAGGRTLQLQDRPCSGLWPNRRQLPIRKWQRSLRWRQPKGERRTGKWKCGWILSARFKMDLKKKCQTRGCMIKATDFRGSQWILIGVWALWTSLVTHWSLKIAQCSQQHRLWSTKPGWTLLSLNLCIHAMYRDKPEKENMFSAGCVFHLL